MSSARRKKQKTTTRRPPSRKHRATGKWGRSKRAARGEESEVYWEAMEQTDEALLPALRQRCPTEHPIRAYFRQSPKCVKTKTLKKLKQVPTRDGPQTFCPVGSVLVEKNPRYKPCVVAYRRKQREQRERPQKRSAPKRPAAKPRPRGRNRRVIAKSWENNKKRFGRSSSWEPLHPQKKNVVKVSDRNHDGDPAALKIIKVKLGQDPKTIEREIKHEFELIKALYDRGCLGIVEYKELFKSKDGKTLYILMDLIQGPRMGSVKKAIAQKYWPMYYDALQSIVKCMHEAGIVHRDIKLDNIMIRASDGEMLIIDFERACRLADCQGMSGTPGYKAPEIEEEEEEEEENRRGAGGEQRRQRRPSKIDFPKADLYSAGKALLRFWDRNLTVEYPRGRSAPKFVAKTTEEETEELPKEVKKKLKALLQRDPNKREWLP